jgi:beta-glucosidase
MARKYWIILGIIAALAIAATQVGVSRTKLYASPSKHNETMAFPKDFYWGAAIAAQHAETQQPTDWTAFELDAFKNKRFETGATLGAAKPGHINDLGSYSEKVRTEKTGFDRLYPQDMAMAKGMGMNAFRTSIDWARLFPREDMTEPDPKGIAFYKSMLAEMKKNGITPFGTLFHFATPEWFFKPDADGKKGWERKDAMVHWQRFVSAVADNFVPDIEQWCTLNEPLTYVYNGYIEGVFPPLERRGDVSAAADVIESLLKAHVIGYNTLHKAAAAKNAKVNVGIAKHTRSFEPLRNWAPLDRLTAQAIDQAWNWDFNDAIESGQLKLTNTKVDKPIEGLKGTEDYVGINYYGRFYVKTDIFNPTKPQVLLHDPDAKDEPYNDLGWAMYPHGFKQILTEAHKRYKKPIYVLENGTADRAENDVLRQRFIVSHLREMWLAMNENKVDVRGYLHWTLFDNFEWAEGFNARFGLVRLDYENDFKRIPRPSAKIYTDIIKANALSPELVTQLGGPK